MKMKFCLLALVSMMICNCSNRRFADSSVVRNSIDSILKANTKAGHFGVSETFWEDDSFYGQRRKQWIFTDSIEKYSTKDDLIELYKSHDSPIIRMVAFHLLLKHMPSYAVRLAIEDIDETDSILAGRCDQALAENVSSIRTRMIMRRPTVYHISHNDSVSMDSAVLNSKFKESNWYYWMVSDQVADSI